MWWPGVQDSETVLEHLVQQGQAQRALAVLRRPSTSPELHYKFAPALMAQVCWPSPALSALHIGKLHCWRVAMRTHIAK